MRIAFAVVVVASCSVVAAAAACGNGDDDDASGTDGGGGDATGGKSDGGGGTTTGDSGAGGGGDDGGGGGGGGTPTKIATGQKNAGGIATNGSAVVWTTNNATVTGGNLTGIGDIMLLATSGATTPTALATNVDNGAMVAVDSTYAYWFGASNNDIYKIPLANDGPAVNLETMLANGIYEMAIDSTNFYWANINNAVHEVPLDGGAQVTLAMLDDAGFDSAYDTQGIAVSSAGVFAATAHTILKIPPGGGSYTTLATDQNPTAIVADATSVYWGNVGSGGIAKIPVGGGTPTVLASLSVQEVPAFMAVDATNLYWIELGGSLKRVSIAGGAAVTLAPAPEAPGGLALDATTLYWTDSANGDVYALAK